MGTGKRAQVAAYLGVLLIVVAVVATGCGGGSSADSAATAATNARPQKTSSEEPTSTGGSTSPSGNPSSEFLKPGEKNPAVEFGKEAPDALREQVSRVVAKSLKAREKADFKTQCTTLTIEAIKQVPGADTRDGCPAGLKQLATPLSETVKARKDTLTGPIDVMRVKGKKGYALWHGNDGKDYVVPLEKEGSYWRLPSILTSEV
jgi:hypothetical protein